MNLIQALLAFISLSASASAILPIGPEISLPPKHNHSTSLKHSTTSVPQTLITITTCNSSSSGHSSTTPYLGASHSKSLIGHELSVTPSTSTTPPATTKTRKPHRPKTSTKPTGYGHTSTTPLTTSTTRGPYRPNLLPPFLRKSSNKSVGTAHPGPYRPAYGKSSTTPVSSGHATSAPATSTHRRTQHVDMLPFHRPHLATTSTATTATSTAATTTLK